MFHARGERKDLDQLLETAKEEGPQTIITENVIAVARGSDPENKLTGVALVQEEWCLKYMETTPKMACNLFIQGLLWTRGI